MSCHRAGVFGRRSRALLAQYRQGAKRETSLAFSEQEICSRALLAAAAAFPPFRPESVTVSPFGDKAKA